MALEHQGGLDCRRGTKEQRAQSGALQDSLGLSGKGNTTWFPAPQTPKELPSLTRLLSFPLPLTATGPTCTEGAMKSGGCPGGQRDQLGGWRGPQWANGSPRVESQAQGPRRLSGAKCKGNLRGFP